MSEIENWSSIGRVSMTNWIFTRKKLCIDFDFRLIALHDKVIYFKYFKQCLNIEVLVHQKYMYVVAYFDPKKYSLKSNLTAWLLCKTTRFSKLSILSSTMNTLYSGTNNWFCRHGEKPVFITGIPAMKSGLPVMKTGFSQRENLHRENPVFITGMRLQCM